jgi:hypothetical protein
LKIATSINIQGEKAKNHTLAKSAAFRAEKEIGLITSTLTPENVLEKVNFASK